MTRVIAPSRLHFGLFHVPTDGEHRAGVRAFGGVGLMIDTPGVVVTAEPAESWRFEGMLASRAQQFAMRFMQSIPEQNRRPFQVLVERCPTEHTGLGVGTQLGLAVGKVLAAALGEPDLESRTLANRVGRGERSAIGVHGFDRGGLIVDAGKLPGEEVSPLLAHVRLPNEWRVVLFVPPAPATWHGHLERAAFAAASSGDPNALRQLAETAIIPAIRAGDMHAFGDAIHEFNRRAGEPFAAAQGGPYASAAIAELIAELRHSGIRAVGQSSWGPTVFAVVPDSDTALSLVLRFGQRTPVSVARISTGHNVTMV
ncbi:MAG: beta-RFAP synthase [Planctomycetaceae bacterium]|nr:beta-RFAP synthase [Planctomycetaceae bacterium]